jgi:ribonuclease E
VADKGSYFSRLFVKFAEILAAAVATAISGYLVAHLNGYLPAQLSSLFPSRAPAPVAVQSALGNVGVSKVAPASLPAPPAPSSTADTAEQRVSPQQDAGAAAGQSVKRSARAASLHKHGKGEAAKEANKEANKEAAKEATKAETTATTTTTDSKARESEDDESVAERVRAALANVDANRPAPAEPPRRGDMPGPAATGVPLRPVDMSPSVAPQPVPQASLQPLPIQSVPAQTAPVQSAPAQSAPIQSAPIQSAPVQAAPLQQADPLTTVEIKSRPVATVDTPAPVQPPPPPEERSVLSALKHILPDFRRSSTPDEAPRPPAPIGE